MAIPLFVPVSRVGGSKSWCGSSFFVCVRVWFMAGFGESLSLGVVCFFCRRAVRRKRPKPRLASGAARAGGTCASPWDVQRWAENEKRPKRTFLIGLATSRSAVERRQRCRCRTDQKTVVEFRGPTTVDEVAAPLCCPSFVFFLGGGRWRRAAWRPCCCCCCRTPAGSPRRPLIGGDAKDKMAASFISVRACVGG